MSATLAIRHHVRDYAAWRKVYDEVEPLRAQHGCIAQSQIEPLRRDRMQRLRGIADDRHAFPAAGRCWPFSQSRRCFRSA